MSVTGDMIEEERVEGWRRGVEASIRRVQALMRKPWDLWHPAYFQALKEAETSLQAMLERGSERAGDTVE